MQSDAMTSCPKIQRSSPTLLAFTRSVSSPVRTGSESKAVKGMGVNMVGRSPSPEGLKGDKMASCPKCGGHVKRRKGVAKCRGCGFLPAIGSNAMAAILQEMETAKTSEVEA